MTEERDVDATIIGAGVIGSAIAFELGKLGYRTLNIDKLPAAGYGPTSNSCAIVRTHYSSKDSVAMAMESAVIWQNWPEYLGSPDDSEMAKYSECGVLLLKSASGQWKKSIAHYNGLGVEYEDWTTDELADRFPRFDIHSYWPPKRPTDPEFFAPSDCLLAGAIFTPHGGFVDDPQLASRNLQIAAESLGGQFLFKSEVASIRVADQRVVGLTLSDGTEIDSRVVVNVAGPHSFLVNRMADVEGEMSVKTRALRVEVHHVPAPSDWDYESDGCIVSDGDLGIYFRPASHNHILVGSEDPECDPREWINDPSEYSQLITQDQWKAQVLRLARRISTLPVPSTRKGVVDLYDVSDDWMPIYDKSSLAGFYMAIGTSGNQFKNAPIAGRMMAQIIDEVERGRDHDKDPVQVKCLYSDTIIDSGAYSRLRDVNRDSSFSVLG